MLLLGIGFMAEMIVIVADVMHAFPSEKSFEFKVSGSKFSVGFELTLITAATISERQTRKRVQTRNSEP
jgi:hypothetical protein